MTGWHVVWLFLTGIVYQSTIGMMIMPDCNAFHRAPCSAGNLQIDKSTYIKKSYIIFAVTLKLRKIAFPI